MDTPPRRPLGRTGLTVSPIGFGAFKIGRNTGTKYADAYDLPDDDRCRAILEGVLELGINLIDTAPAYGTSEERIGRLLGARRDDFVLSTKVGETFEDGRSRYDFTADAVDRSIDRSLERLRTDRIDLLFVHSDGNDASILRAGETLEAMSRRRDLGDVRCIGFSGKTADGHRLALDLGVDVLMVEYHLHDDSQRAVMEAAESCGVGVVVKKGLASGRIPAAEAVPHCLAGPGVASLVVGSLNLAHLEANLRAASGGPDRDDQPSSR